MASALAYEATANQKPIKGLCRRDPRERSKHDQMKHSSEVFENAITMDSRYSGKSQDASGFVMPVLLVRRNIAHRAGVSALPMR